MYFFYADLQQASVMKQQCASKKGEKGAFVKRKKDIDSDLVCNLYLSGTSENELSKIFSVARNAIALRLKERGIKRRSASEAEALKWARMSKEQRENQVKKAHDSVRGVAMSEKSLFLQSVARQSISKFIGVGETEIASILSGFGLCVKTQAPFFRYNLDLLVNDWLIVEITSAGGDILLQDRHMGKTKKALENKMSIIWVKFSSRKQLLNLIPEVSKRIREIAKEKPIGPFCKIIKCRSSCEHEKDSLKRFAKDYKMKYFLEEKNECI